MASPEPPPSEPLGDAFRELHTQRLYGFAMIVTLGDWRRAALACEAALREGEERVAELRHPERAAAWLRARVLRRIRGEPTRMLAEDRADALERMGVDEAVFAGLAALDVTERAALVLASVERLDLRDVGVAVDQNAARLDRVLRRARVRYASAAARAMGADAQPSGPTVARIRAVAARALS